MLDSFPMMAVPLFILSGEVMSRGGIAQKLIKFSSVLVGHIRGSQAQVTIVSNLFMSCVSGSASAGCTAIGSIMVPSMLEEGYDKDYAVAVLGSSSVLGAIIPPSIMMVIYGSMANVSVGKMFIGGYIPGLILVAGLMGLSYYYATKRKYVVHKRSSFKEIGLAFKDAFWALLMPVIILGGIMSGAFTPTEAGGVACLYAFIVGFATGNIKIRDLKSIFYKSAVSTTVPMLIIGIAAIFGWLLTINNFHQYIGIMFRSITDSPLGFLMIVLVFYFVFGLFIESNAVLIIMTPVLAPMAAKYGIDPIQFGVVNVIALIIGALTPPVGILLFISTNLAQTKLDKVLGLVWRYAFLLIALTFVFALFPQIVIWLPNLLMK
jgi:C4-dicarboxylate transporter DctM subunit